MKSGCIVQKENGKIVVQPPEKAEEVFNAMDRKHKKMYYKEIKRTK